MPRTRYSVWLAAVSAILVVDDDRVVAGLAAEILRAEGYDVHVAHDAPEALATVERVAVDVLVTDVVLGSVDGVDLAEAVGRVRPGARVVFMSGYGHTRGAATPNDPVLGKPFTPAELRERVAEALAS
jgi:two-component system, cell cycle sensor histidine kinase and response regulator CckA